jgi:hypothetical protein
MKKIILVIGGLFILQSCVVNTAAKVVKTVAKVGYGAVKTTVKGISWAVSKAKGKIDEDKINGSWKLVGIYQGGYAEYANDKNPSISFTSECSNDFDVMVFKSKKSKFQPIHCNSQDEDWVKYSFEYGKNPQTKERENYIEFNSRNYISVIDITNKTMVLEGNLLNNSTYSGNKLYLFEKN